MPGNRTFPFVSVMSIYKKNLNIEKALKASLFHVLVVLQVLLPGQGTS